MKQNFEISEENIQLKQSTNDNEIVKSMIVDNLQTELEAIRNENEQLNQIVNDLNKKIERQTSDPNENIQV